MPAIDHEVGALAELAKRTGEICQFWAQFRVARVQRQGRQVPLHANQQLDDLLHMSSKDPGVVRLGQNLQIGEQIDGRPRRYRTQLDIAFCVDELRVATTYNVAKRREEFRLKTGRNINPASFAGAIDKARDFVPKYRIFLAALGPKHLLDRGLEQLHPALNGRIATERSDGVVEEERRARPKADQARRTRIAAASGGHEIRAGLAGDGIVRDNAS